MSDVRTLTLRVVLEVPEMAHDAQLAYVIRQAVRNLAPGATVVKMEYETLETRNL